MSCPCQMCGDGRASLPGQARPRTEAEDGLPRRGISRKVSLRVTRCDSFVYSHNQFSDRPPAEAEALSLRGRRGISGQVSCARAGLSAPFGGAVSQRDLSHQLVGIRTNSWSFSGRADCPTRMRVGRLFYAGCFFFFWPGPTLTEELVWLASLARLTVSQAGKSAGHQLASPDTGLPTKAS